MVEYVHRTITIQAMDGPLQIHLAARELFQRSEPEDRAADCRRDCGSGR